MCNHSPRCPQANGAEPLSARVLAPHLEQGWNLLCNGVITFDDGGALLPDGEAIAPLRQRSWVPATRSDASR
jgi:hypothetical protein